MPSGPKKRRPNKKKKKKDKGASEKSVSTPAPPPPHGESDGGQLNSPASKDQHNSPPPAVKAEASDINLSGNKPLTIKKTEKAIEGKQGKSEIDRGSISQQPHTTSLNSRDRSSDASDINLSGNKSLTIETTEKAVEGKQGKSEIDRGSTSQQPHATSLNSRNRSSNANDINLSGNKPLTIKKTEKAIVGKQGKYEIDRGSISQQPHTTSLNSRDRSSDASDIKLSGNKPLTIETTEKAVEGKQGKSEIDRGSTSQQPHATSLNSRNRSSNANDINLSENKPLITETTEKAVEGKQGKSEIDRGSTSRQPHATSLNSRNRSSNASDNNLSGNKPLTIETTEKVVEGKQGKSEIDRGSTSQQPHATSLNSRNSSSNASDINLSENKPLIIETTEKAVEGKQGKSEIDRGSTSQQPHTTSLNSRNGSSNGSDINLSENKPLITETTEKAVEGKQGKSEIDRGSTSRQPHATSLNSRNGSSNASDINLSENKPLIIETTEKAVEGKQGKSEIDRGSTSQQPHATSLNSRNGSSNSKFSDKKKSVVIEPAPVPDLVQPIRCQPEKETCKVEDFAVDTPPIVDSIKSVDHFSGEVNNNKKTKLEGKNELVVAETALADKVVNENASKNKSSTPTSVVVESVPKENGTKMSVSSPQKTSAKSKEYLPASTFKCPFCGKSSADYVNEPEMSECSEKQPLLASAPQAAEKTSWKSCCGIFELFSGSGR